MNDALDRFLENKKPMVEDSDIWGNGTLHLQIKSYISDALPPRPYITSIRCILLQKDSVLVLRNPNGLHIIPGGRIEEDEHFDQTLKREILEETGWTISSQRYLGFLHFHHLTPKPQEYPYPYPDFIQLIYTAQAVDFITQAKNADDYEIEATFYPVDTIDCLEIPKFQHLYLNEALKSD